MCPSFFAKIEFLGFKNKKDVFAKKQVILRLPDRFVKKQLFCKKTFKTVYSWIMGKKFSKKNRNVFKIKTKIFVKIGIAIRRTESCR
jgi:hypothetical protein